MVAEEVEEEDAEMVVVVGMEEEEVVFKKETSETKGAGLAPTLLIQNIYKDDPRASFCQYHRR